MVASRPVSAPSEAATPRSSVTAEATVIPTTYSNYVLFVLFIVYVFNAAEFERMTERCQALRDASYFHADERPDVPGWAGLALKIA